MKIDDIRALPDDELAQAIAWGQDEHKARTERKRQETVAHIRELAASVGVAVAFKGQRLRPGKQSGHRKNEKPDGKGARHAG